MGVSSRRHGRSGGGNGSFPHYSGIHHLWHDTHHLHLSHCPRTLSLRVVRRRFPRRHTPVSPTPRHVRHTVGLFRACRPSGTHSRTTSYRCRTACGGADQDRSSAAAETPAPQIITSPRTGSGSTTGTTPHFGCPTPQTKTIHARISRSPGSLSHQTHL